jgi:hypothetical protein
MSVFKRYFRITEGPVVDEIDRLQELLAVAAVSASKVAEQTGGEFQTWQSTGGFAGFKFKQTPCEKTFRFIKKTGLWLPRKNTPEGKAVWSDIEQVPLPDPVCSAIKLAGLSPNFPALFDGGRMYSPVLWGFGKPVSVWFVSVPWKDVDPDRMAAYQKERAVGGSFSNDLEHLSWQAPIEWVEVKEWQVSKESEEIVERQKVSQ